MIAPETFRPNSTHIRSIDYDPDSEDMTVEFRSGDTYLYRNVPEGVYRQWQTAGSAGEYFQRHVKNRYAYEAV